MCRGRRNLAGPRLASPASGAGARPESVGSPPLATTTACPAFLFIIISWAVKSLKMMLRWRCAHHRCPAWSAHPKTRQF